MKINDKVKFRNTTGTIYDIAEDVVFVETSEDIYVAKYEEVELIKVENDEVKKIEKDGIKRSITYVVDKEVEGYTESGKIYGKTTRMVDIKGSENFITEITKILESKGFELGWRDNEDEIDFVTFIVADKEEYNELKEIYKEVK